MRETLYRIITILAVLFLLSNVVAKAQEYSDTLSVSVYFPCGSSNIAKYHGNLQLLEQFIHKLDSMGQLHNITPISLSVTSSTSPEGGIVNNRLLSRRRGQSALEYLNNKSETFKAISTSIGCRNEELTTNHLLSKTQQANYPAMRFAKVDLLIACENKDTLAVAMEQPIVTSDSISYYASGPEKQTEEILQADTVPGLDADRTITTTFSPIFFVKTNLLYDLLTVVNASVEVPLSKRVTAEATLVYPWWRNTAKHKTVQLRYVAVTPRYYFKNNEEQPYTSFFAGLTVGTGTYDLQWTRRGVQGKLWNVSPTFGYTHHIARRWKMEYSASVGYVQTKYTKYTQMSDTPYGEIKVKDYPWVSHVLKTVLPISLNVSIVYTIGKHKQLQHHEN